MSPAEKQGRSGLTACVIAMNEEDRIADCLASLEWCDEIIVVDSHSTDRTREIAADFGARVIERDWPGHGAQRDFAASAANNDWMLCLDADERVSQLLREELIALREEGFPDKAGWRMPRLSCFLGRWIRHGTWYPNRQLRLYDRRHGRWSRLMPHEHVELDGPAGTLRGPILHYPYRSFAEHLAVMDRYTTITANGLQERGRRARVSDIVFRPAIRFVRTYFLKRGFLDGWRGLLLAYLTAYYGRLKYAKLLVLQRETPPPAPPAELAPTSSTGALGPPTPDEKARREGVAP